jgi:hypothetical protein
MASATDTEGSHNGIRCNEERDQNMTMLTEWASTDPLSALIQTSLRDLIYAELREAAAARV